MYDGAARGDRWRHLLLHLEQNESEADGARGEQPIAVGGGSKRKLVVDRFRRFVAEVVPVHGREDRQRGVRPADRHVLQRHRAGG